MSEIRLNCIVPGCRHTRGRRKGEPPILDGEEWICGDHWKAVPAFMRRRKTLVGRRYRCRFGNTQWWEFPAGSPERLQAVRLDRMRRMAWRLCRRAAVERGLGI